MCKNLEDCEHFIRGKHGHPQYEQIFLIVTSDYIHPILQQGIHDIRVLQAILIFHQNKCEFSITFKPYPKVCLKKRIYANGISLVWYAYRLKEYFLIQMNFLYNFQRSVDNFSKESGILISTLKGCDVEMTTNIINNFADYSELWFPLFIDLLFDLVRINLKFKFHCFILDRL